RLNALYASQLKDWRHPPLVLALRLKPCNARLELGATLSRQEVAVQLSVGHPQLLFVGLPFPKPSRRRFADDLVGDSQFPGQLPHLGFHQSPKRHEVDAGVAKFGEITDRELAP